MQDLRFAVRLFAKDRWFSAAAVVALALGLGVNAIGFTIVNAAFFRTVPFEDADRLYMVSWLNRAGRRVDVLPAEWRAWRGETGALADLAGYRDDAINVSDERAFPEQVRAAWVTANFFRVLAQPPLLGRGFADGDDQPGAQPVVIIGDSVWRSRYGADPNVLGSAVRLNGQPATIVGVMPDAMKFPDNTAVWAPFVPGRSEETGDEDRLTIIGRLPADVSRGEVNAILNGIATRTIAARADTHGDFVGMRVESVADAFVGGIVRRLFLVVMGAVVVVLLIACANVANLLLSRSGRRAREMATRMALGATRWRVVRQLLLESILLGLIGSGVGLCLTVAGVALFDAAMLESGKPYWIVFTVDYAVLAYMAGIGIATAVLFGLAPALHVSRRASAFAPQAWMPDTPRVRWFSNALVVVEIALSLMLLAGGGLMVRSFINAYHVDLGIDTRNLMTMQLMLPETRYRDAAARREFFARLEPRVAAIAGVEAVAVTTGVPPNDGGERLLEVDGADASARPRFVSTVTITPRFFATVGVRLLRGRNLDDRDGDAGLEHVVVNDRLVAQFFAGQDPIGQRIRFTARTSGPDQPARPGRWHTIVGVSPTIRHGSPDDEYLSSVVYIPYRQEAPASASLLVRAALPPTSVMDAVRREVQGLDRDQPVFTMQTMDQMLAQTRWPYRAFGGLFVVFAIVSLLLSSVGLYAVMAYSVSERTKEIGVRVAIGAAPSQVSWLILKRGLAQLAIGLPLGLAGALAMGVMLQSLLVGLTPGDPLTFAGITALLVAVSLVACLVPARRATRVDPLMALRVE